MSKQQTATVSQHEPVWYKQFWPWFLIILPGIVVIASISTVIIAFKGADDLVADNYYKEGLAINKTVSDIHAAKSLNIQSRITFQGSTVSLNITANTPINDEILLLSFNHPLEDQQDIAIHLKNTGNGEYQANMPAIHPGKWYLTLSSLDAAKPWRINTTVFLPSATIDMNAE